MHNPATRDESARLAAHKLCRRKLGNSEFEIDSDSHVTHLDEEGTEVEGWAYVNVAVLVPAEMIDREEAS